MRFWQGSNRPRPFVVAHRGGALLGPENTVPTILSALTVGADAVEVDVRLTADGHLVCCHDADLTRISGDNRKVDALNYATMCNLYPDLMTLRQAIAASGEAGLLLDIKVADETILSSILAQIVHAKGRTLLGLRSLNMVRCARALDPDIDILAFSSDPDSSEMAARMGATWFRLWQADATSKRLEAVRSAGLRPAVMVGQPRALAKPEWPHFPVGGIDQAGLSALLCLEPDAVLLDDPRLLRPTVPRTCHSDVV